MRKIDEDFAEKAEDLDDSVLRQAYHDAMESTNTYPVAEYSGVYVDVDRILSAFIVNLETHTSGDE